MFGTPSVDCTRRKPACPIIGSGAVDDLESVAHYQNEKEKNRYFWIWGSRYSMAYFLSIVHESYFGSSSQSVTVQMIILC
jgi:hypothetical protein